MITTYKQKFRKTNSEKTVETKKSPLSHSKITKTNYADKDKDKLKVIVLGGLEEVGRNMTLFEYNKEIIIVDMGLMFPEEDMPGIDYIIPDISYLKGKTDWIKGVIITHGHLDHIGAIHHLMEEIGNPPLFTGTLTSGLINHKWNEKRKSSVLNMQIIDETSELKLGKNFKVSFLRVNHSIPDCFASIMDTPVGRVIHTGDFKIDFSPVNDKPADLNRIAQIGGEGVRLLLSDSTSSVKPGYQISESAIGDEIGRIIEDTTGRIIIGIFASQLNRIQKILSLAEKYGRRVNLQGRSIVNNIEIAHQVGHLKFNPKVLVEDRELNSLPDDKVVIIGTGGQGEDNAFLARVVNKDHRTIKLKKGDTVVFSSSIIPGNERSIQNLKDVMVRQGASIIHYEMMDVHAGGHAKAEDLKLMMRLLKPEYFMPIEGNHYLLVAHAELAEQVGIPREKIFVADNGQVIEVYKDKSNKIVGKKTNHKVPTEYIMVDGLGVGDISSIVLRDRRIMSNDGMLVIIAMINAKTKTILGNPDIISRGFIYMKDQKELVEDIRSESKRIVQTSKINSIADIEGVRNDIRDEISALVFKKTNRRPMVLPVVKNIYV